MYCSFVFVSNLYMSFLKTMQVHRPLSTFLHLECTRGLKAFDLPPILNAHTSNVNIYIRYIQFEILHHRVASKSEL